VLHVYFGSDFVVVVPVKWMGTALFKVAAISTTTNRFYIHFIQRCRNTVDVTVMKLQKRQSNPNNFNYETLGWLHVSASKEQSSVLPWII
jgi:hypothetical protein